MLIHKKNVTVRDGTEIEILLISPVTKPKAVVQLQGGGGLKKEFYRHFALFLASRGFVVILLDYRGIGGSTLNFLSSGDADLLDWVRLDMAGVFSWSIAEFPEIPKFILGHSIGGILSGLIENLHDAKGIVLLCSSSGDWRQMSAPYRIIPGFLFNVYIPAMARFLKYIPLRFLGIMDDLPRGVGVAMSKLATQRNFLKQQIAVQPCGFEKYAGPLLSLFVEDDPIAPEAIAKELYDLFHTKNREFIKISPRDFSGIPIGHFGFFSRRFKDSLWLRIALWFEQKMVSRD